MLLIGLTGGIGSGKTFISKIINSYKKFKIFDSDFEAKKIIKNNPEVINSIKNSFCLLYTSPSPRDRLKSRMPSSA